MLEIGSTVECLGCVVSGWAQFVLGVLGLFSVLSSLPEVRPRSVMLVRPSSSKHKAGFV